MTDKHHDRLYKGSYEALSKLDDELWALFPIQLRGMPRAQSQFSIPYMMLGNGLKLREGDLITASNKSWSELAAVTLRLFEAEAQGYQEPVAIVWRRPLEARAEHLKAGTYPDFSTGEDITRAVAEDHRRLTCRFHFMRYELIMAQIAELRTLETIKQKTAPRGL